MAEESIARVCARHPELKGKRYSNGSCAACDNERGVKWAKANRNKHNANAQAWREANREKARAASKAWTEANRQKVRIKVNSRYSGQRERTPLWANLDAIRAIYAEAARNRLHVDHIVPLKGKLVSGLHVENNLQLLPLSENIRKTHHFDPLTHVHVLPKGT